MHSHCDTTLLRLMVKTTDVVGVYVLVLRVFATTTFCLCVVARFVAVGVLAGAMNIRRKKTRFSWQQIVRDHAIVLFARRPPGILFFVFFCLTFFCFFRFFTLNILLADCALPRWTARRYRVRPVSQLPGRCANSLCPKYACTYLHHVCSAVHRKAFARP